MAEKKPKDGAYAPNWRPDFRDNDALPDVKAVRTNFLVNFVALALAILSVGWFGYTEFQGMTIQSQIEDLQAGINSESAKNRTNLKDSSAFAKESPKAEDLVAFYKGYEYPLDVLMQLSSSRPETIALQSITLGKGSRNAGTQKRPNIVYSPQYTLRGVLKGDNVEALQELDEYKIILQELELFSERLKSIDVSVPKRNQTLGLFEFTIVINLNEAA
ncbi:hypothetical protein [Cerasicoccus arenae]|uniref:Uncharacterized protein n=1 Tax=Cerasicoccus arenae TaxID=424488 RepID=A0A8J3DFA8_9BACT|nr:hypothetical protein [Cerasicoccus arenae]MBK1859308.1 hypothetical protein [Cerasicoccus arenae]GHB94254.1 hypothetical protein GCM10007047_07410 [Cerasicoccus arenae]